MVRDARLSQRLPATRTSPIKSSRTHAERESSTRLASRNKKTVTRILGEYTSHSVPGDIVRRGRKVRRVGRAGTPTRKKKYGTRYYNNIVVHGSADKTILFSCVTFDLTDRRTITTVPRVLRSYGQHVEATTLGRAYNIIHVHEHVTRATT